MSKYQFYAGMVPLLFILVGLERFGTQLLLAIIRTYHLETLPSLDFYIILISALMQLASFVLLISLISKGFGIIFWIRIYVAGLLGGLGVIWTLAISLTLIEV